ncbi:MAG: hypothetical protein QXZ13_00090 [Candidatus Diapherotrites archaeon]
MALGVESNKESRANELTKSFESGGKRLSDNQTGLTKPSIKFNNAGSPPLS